MPLVIVVGLASGKTYGPFSLTTRDEDVSLLDFLRVRGIPLASSCGGEGVCETCRVNKSLLSCQVSMKSLVKNLLNSENYIPIEVDYL